MATAITRSTADPSIVVVDSRGAYQHQQQNEIAQLKANLSRYTKANDRRMVLRSLMDVKALSFVQLEGSSSLAELPDILTSDLEKEVSNETMKLNSMTFSPKKSSVVVLPRKEAIAKVAYHSGPTIMLKGLIEELCRNNAVVSAPSSTSQSQVLYKQILARAARSTGSADAYFQLNSMLGSSDLMVMQLPSSSSSSSRASRFMSVGKISSASSSSSNTKEDDIDLKPISTSSSRPSKVAPLGVGRGSTSTTTAVNDDDKDCIKLNLYKQHGQVHMTLDMTYDFGLFRKSDVKPNKPWIALHAVVHERANLSTGKSVRSMRVQYPELY